MVEHCDAPAPASAPHPASKGFLTIDAEIEAIKAANANADAVLKNGAVGMAINWASNERNMVSPSLALSVYMCVGEGSFALSLSPALFLSLSLSLSFSFCPSRSRSRVRTVELRRHAHLLKFTHLLVSCIYADGIRLILPHVLQ